MSPLYARRTMKVAILYASSTGKTEAVARRIHALFPGSVLFPVAQTTGRDMAPFDLVLVGTPTWGTGALPEAWNRRLGDFPPGVFTGKTLAFFGLGDNVAFATTFCTAVLTLRHRFAPGALLVLDPPLLLDDDNRADLTEGMVTAWVHRIKDEAGADR